MKACKIHTVSIQIRLSLERCYHECVNVYIHLKKLKGVLNHHLKYCAMCLLKDSNREKLANSWRSTFSIQILDTRMFVHFESVRLFERRVSELLMEESSNGTQMDRKVKNKISLSVEIQMIIISHCLNWVHWRRVTLTE